MSNRTEKKSSFLGMNFGTAHRRLLKQLLFRSLRKSSEDVCFKCGEKIETETELSIEHIKPWENISVDLFWDLSNIVFSHLRCNRNHRNPGPLKQRPEGTNWCVPGQHFAPTEKFYKGSSVLGLQHWCKDHRYPRVAK